MSPVSRKAYCHKALRDGRADYKNGRHFRRIRTTKRTDSSRRSGHRESARQPFDSNPGSRKRLEIRLGEEYDLFDGLMLGCEHLFRMCRFCGRPDDPPRRGPGRALMSGGVEPEGYGVFAELAGI
jgi:hypothetical protein